MIGGCDTCAGDGVVDVDRFTPGRGHFTEVKPCPKCYGEPRQQLELELHDPPTIIDLAEAYRAVIERQRRP